MLNVNQLSLRLGLAVAVVPTRKKANSVTRLFFRLELLQKHETEIGLVGKTFVSKVGI